MIQMARMERTKGPHVTRRIEEPRGLTVLRHAPGPAAQALADAHNAAVRAYGSDSGGYHAFDPATPDSMGVWDGGFPRNTVVTPLAWGRVDAWLAQRLLEADGWIDDAGAVRRKVGAQ